MAYIHTIEITNDQSYLIEPTLYIAPSKDGAAYTATLANFSLVTGATIQAKFAATNDANATLNVNSTGAKEIYYNGAEITANQFKVNHVYTLVYDGTQWQVVGDINTNTTYSAMSVDEARTGTATNSRLIRADRLKTFLSTLGGTGLDFVHTSEKIELNHSNSVTAKASYVDTATTASANGGKIKVTDIKYDAQGHITGSQDRTITLSGISKVSTGVGLTGGDITTTGTIKVDLTNEAKLTYVATDGTETSGRVYPVRLDKNGKLAVNVPWTNINDTYLPLSGGTMTGNINLETNSDGDTNIDGTIVLANSGTKIIQKMRNTSNWGTALAWDNTTTIGTTYLPGIGWHNQKASAEASAEDKGGITIIPYGTNTSPWGKSVGLFISKTDLKWEGKNVAYFTTATSSTTNGQVLISDSTADGGIKNSGYTIKTSVPANAVFTDHYDWDDITNKPSTATSWPKWNQILAGADGLSNGSDNVTDNTEILTSYASNNGFADTNAKGVVYRRDAIKLYNYINGKLGTMAHETATDYAKLDGAAFTGAVTVQAPAEDMNPATKEYVDSQISTSFAANNAMVYKGIIAGAATSDNNAYGALTPTANCGDTYKVSVAGFVNGLRVEVGDMLICTTDDTVEATSSNYTTVRNNWNIIQTSEGSVSTAVTQSSDNMLAVFHEASGRIIKTATHISAYPANDNITVQNATKYRNGLRIYGQTYGNTATDLTSNLKGVIRYEDGGPRIEFSASATGGSDNGAIIFTNHDSSNTGGGSSFHFVGQDSSNDTGGDLAVTAPDFVARRRLMVGKNFTDASYTAYINGATYLNGNTTVNGDLIFPQANKLDWNGATYRQRIVITDDSTADSPVFTFQQSADTGSNYTDLFTIKDNGTVVATTFDGNATSATSAGKWTTARTLTIGSTGKSVDGSGNVSWTLAEIGAAPAVTGGYLPLSGGKMTGRIYREGKSTNWHKGRDNALVATSALNGYSPFASIKTTSGSWDIGAYNNSSYTDDLIFSYVTDTQYSGSSATTTAQIKFLEDGHIVAELDGNATSATKATYLGNVGRLASMDVDFGTYTNNSKFFISYADGDTITHKPYQNAMILNVAWDNLNSNKYGAQIAIGNSTTPHLQLRGCANGTWDANWLTVLDSNNTSAASSSDISVGWNTSTTIATINGTAVKIKIPSNPNTNTTYTFAEGSTNGAFSVTPSGGSAQSIKIHGLAALAYIGTGSDTTKYLNNKGEWTTPPNDNTHYTTKLIAGDSSATSNKAVSSGNIYLRIFDDNEPRDPIQIKPGDNMTITSDASGIITFKATDTKNTAYGNISTSGTMSSTGVALANGDQLLFSDSSASGKIERTSITFDANTETECLTKKGTWKAFNNYSLPTAKYDTLGGVKPWYSHTKASTGPSAGSNATAVAVNAIQDKPGRYYAIESDSNGRLFVNIPWTDTNNAATHTVKTTAQYYITGTETITTSTDGDTFDPGIYATTTAGQLNATSYKVNEKVTLQWNSTDSSLDFIFA